MYKHACPIASPIAFPIAPRAPPPVFGVRLTVGVSAFTNESKMPAGLAGSRALKTLAGFGFGSCSSSELESSK